jgi:hypothetical protein
MDIEDHIFALVTKKLIDEASEQHLQELDELLRQHPDIHARVRLLDEWWQDSEKSTEANSRTRFKKILERIKANQAKLGHIN